MGTLSWLDGVLHASGEHDLATVTEGWNQALAAVKATGQQRLVVDLHACTFIDSTVLGALVIAHRDGMDITIVRPSRFCRRALEATGLDGLFTIID